MPTDEGTPASTFPVVVALEAIDAWIRDPTEHRRVFLAQALESIVRAAGARGALLEFSARPLPAFRGGFGSLQAVEPGAQPAGAQAYRLRANAGRVDLGTLWLDGGGHDAPFAARALERALRARRLLVAALRGQPLRVADVDDEPAVGDRAQAAAGVLERRLVHRQTTAAGPSSALTSA